MLPGDLVRRIVDSFLDDNDLDWYMEYRTVCTGWRAATDDPRSDASNPRFHPSRWIILDEVFQSQGNLLVLNTDTVASSTRIFRSSAITTSWLPLSTATSFWQKRPLLTPLVS